MIRTATIDDASEIQAIYAPYVEKTSISFEYEVPSVEEMKQRIQTIGKQYPYFVMEINQRIVGYAYASTFRSRPAYQWCAELSIYVDENEKGKGIGTALYKALLEQLKQKGFHSVCACITYPNEDSIAFHEKMGFTLNAHFHECGFKMNQWWDMVYMEKQL